MADGHGGSRPGAGRKPWKKGESANVFGMDGKPHDAGLPPPVSSVDNQALRKPPSDLSASAKTFWKRWAALALANRTLTAATAFGFRELCEKAATVAALRGRIALLGAATQDALPYLKECRGQAQALNVSLKEFKLTAFGRPETSEKPKPAANPWAAVAKS